MLSGALLFVWRRTQGNGPLRFASVFFDVDAQMRRADGAIRLTASDFARSAGIRDKNVNDTRNRLLGVVSLHLCLDRREVRVIAFQDFVPEQLKAAGMFSLASYETFAAALQAANTWLADERVRVINIETVALPNFHNSNEEGPQDVNLVVIDGHAYWHQFIRVWYERKENEDR